jgi:hypothetical protein
MGEGIMTATKAPSGVGAFLRLGEERLTALLTQLLSSETFVSALQRAIGSALKAKGTMDRSLTKILSSFNVPTLEDVALLRGKLQELEEALSDLHKSVAMAEEKLGAGEKGVRKRRKNREEAAAPATTSGDRD